MTIPCVKGSTSFLDHLSNFIERLLPIILVGHEALMSLWLYLLTMIELVIFLALVVIVFFKILYVCMINAITTEILMKMSMNISIVSKIVILKLSSIVPKNKPEVNVKTNANKLTVSNLLHNLPY